MPCSGWSACTMKASSAHQLCLVPSRSSLCPGSSGWAPFNKYAGPGHMPCGNAAWPLISRRVLILYLASSAGADKLSLTHCLHLCHVMKVEVLVELGANNAQQHRQVNKYGPLAALEALK